MFPRQRTAVPAIEALEDRKLLSAVNILVSGTGKNNSMVIYEYTQAGKLLKTIPVPNSPAGYGQLKDITVDPAGRINAFYDSSPLNLGVYNGSTWTWHEALNWSLFGVTYEGKIAAYNNYIYAESQTTGANKGITRFDSSKITRPSFIKLLMAKAASAKLTTSPWA